MNIFRVKFDSISTAISTVGILVFLVVILSFINNYIANKSIGYILLAIFVLLLPIVFYLRIPKYIYIDNGSLIIKQNLGEIIIKDIVKIYKVSSVPPMTYGTKGFFGYQGNSIDDFASFIMDKSNIVAIETNHKKYLISCENSSELIAIANSNIIKE